ncbi:MAG: DUF2490 domain-containing protein [Woeseiaceae bacterium]|nr:DUF2490 domain-containing protein [Woeseiaceae bacterium]
MTSPLMKYLATVLMAAPLALAGSPGACATDDDTGIWGIASTGDTIRLNNQPTNWQYAIDGQLRRFNRGSGSNTYLLRPAIGYVLENNVSLWAGYARVVNDPDDGSTRHENRWWQQAAWTARRWDWGTLSLRSRLEFRFIEGSNDTGTRFRQQVQLTAPIRNSDLSLVLSLEPFVNLRGTDWGAAGGFDQNRTYAGVRMPMTDSLSLEAGYMHQYIRRAGAEDAVNHVGLLHLRFRL